MNDTRLTLYKHKNTLSKVTKIIELLPHLNNFMFIDSDILDYDLIIEIWNNFSETRRNIKQTNTRNQDIVNLTLYERDNGLFFEKLFLDHMVNFEDDLIMIYKKNEPYILYLLKTHQIFCDIYTPAFFTYTCELTDQEMSEILEEGQIIISFKK